MPPILHSHRLADLVLVVVLLLGAWSYFAMPRAQYPEVELNWVAVAVVWPGAGARDVERDIAIPLETAVRRVPDISLVTTTSRDHVATLLVRFKDLPHARFERRLAALDREIRQAAAAFPKEARSPQVIELTSSNFFPTAMVVVSGEAADGRVCRLAETTRQALEHLPGVGRVWAYGLRNRELAVSFDPKALERENVSLEALTRAVAEQTRGLPAGMADIGGRTSAGGATRCGSRACPPTRISWANCPSPTPGAAWCPCPAWRTSVSACLPPGNWCAWMARPPCCCR